MYRKIPPAGGMTKVEVFLVHPGGPLWAKKDAGVWSIPKGLVENENDNLLETAKREFHEETGIEIPDSARMTELGLIIYKNGKQVYAWAFENDIPDPIEIKSNLFSMGWPPKSGKFQEFPEADRGQFFNLEEAKLKIIPAQTDLFIRLKERLSNNQS